LLVLYSESNDNVVCNGKLPVETEVKDCGESKKLGTAECM
jgi:hypothetical protein